MGSPTYIIMPEYWNSDIKITGKEYIEKNLCSGTHGAYVNLINGETDVIIASRDISRNEQHEDSQTEHEETYGEEKPEEILHIVTEVGSIVLLVPLLNPLALFIEHVIDLSDMLLHRSRHPLLLLGVHFLNLLPVFISDPD